MTSRREVILYTRRGCGLCDEAAIELRTLSGELGFSFSERDVDAHLHLKERYGDAIPVVEANGREVARAPFVAEELREILEQALV